MKWLASLRKKPGILCPINKKLSLWGFCHRMNGSRGRAGFRDKTLGFSDGSPSFPFVHPTNVRTNLGFLRGAARTPIDLTNEEEARFTKMMAALVDAIGQPVLSPCARNRITVSCRSPASSRRVDHVVTPHRENEWNMSRRDVVRARHHRANIGC